MLLQFQIVRHWQRRSRQDTRKLSWKWLTWYAWLVHYLCSESLPSYKRQKKKQPDFALPLFLAGLGWLCCRWWPVWRKTEERDVSIFHGGNVRYILTLVFYHYLCVFDGDNREETMIVLRYLWLYIQSQETHYLKFTMQVWWWRAYW